jgi:hypothetical protein
MAAMTPLAQWQAAPARPALIPFSFIRTIPSAPELHRICCPILPRKTLATMALAGFGMSPIYRRWGIAPRPENASPKLATVRK